MTYYLLYYSFGMSNNTTSQLPFPTPSKLQGEPSKYHMSCVRANLNTNNFIIFYLLRYEDIFRFLGSSTLGPKIQIKIYKLFAIKSITMKLCLI